MNRIVLAGAAVAVVAGSVVYFFGTSARHPPPASNPERAGIERSLSPFVAMHKAPEGKTPCETSYNAFRALADALAEQHRDPPWVSFPDRDTYLQRCGALSQDEQHCMQPRYQAQHHETCDPLTQGVKNRNALYVTR